MSTGAQPRGTYPGLAFIFRCSFIFFFLFFFFFSWLISERRGDYFSRRGGRWWVLFTSVNKVARKACKNNIGVLYGFPCAPQLPCGAHKPLRESPSLGLRAEYILPRSIPPSLLSDCFILFFLGLPFPNRAMGWFWGGIGFVWRKGSLKEGSSAELFSQNRLMHKR